MSVLGVKGERETGSDVRQGNGSCLLIFSDCSSRNCKYRQVQFGSPRPRQDVSRRHRRRDNNKRRSDHPEATRSGASSSQSSSGVVPDSRQRGRRRYYFCSGNRSRIAETSQSTNSKQDPPYDCNIWL